MEKVDLNLLAIINRIISDFSDPSRHYMVVANYSFYFDELTNFAPVYFNNESIEEILLTDDGLRCKFSFETANIDERFTIKIPYDQIGRISKCDDRDFTEEHVLFLNEDIMLRYNHAAETVIFYNN
ncbi:hypothetical protein [Dyadobacter frigoris]|uniref:Uncharacterized protein n=1 Tax=Dyadobacter frigoris TaxID=2576211 RepID=A0A4U6D3Q6_9BACT|nr:hypothetical protein [Dyadobacter frigoris]TKT90771.1 hypothetical protein FDK13_17540 [Dyadobacter frigoris]GLU52106.1 hypothetical protein Dfri01_15670 [Dyadobacter frigoris]